MTETITLAQALAEADRLQAAAEKWAAEEAAKTAELDDFERASAARLVDDPAAADRLTDEAARLRAGLALTTRTKQAAEGQLAEARRAVVLARAGELRAQAAALTAEADDLDAQAAPLLARLEQLMGCTYAPATSYGASGVVGIGAQEMTLAQRRRHQAAHAERQAEELERFAAERTAEQIAARAGQIAAQETAGGERVAVA